MANKDIDERVAAALPQGERFRAAFLPELASYSNGGDPYAPDEHRPEVFTGLRMPGDGWGRFIGTLGRIVTSDLMHSPVKGCSDPAQREKLKKRQNVFYGGWTSSAGQLLAAVQPRSKAGVVPTVTLTDRALRVVYVQRRRGSFAKLGGATALGWSCPLNRLSWVREHPAWGTGTSYEFGFPDSSWGVLALQGEDDFRQHYPNTLPKKASMPL